MQKLFFRMVDFWSNDRSFSVVLGILVLIVFILSPLKSIQFPTSGILLELFLTILLVSGIFAVSNRRSVRYPAMVIGTITFAVKWLNAISYNQILTRIDLLLSIVYFIALLVVILQKVFGEGKISLKRIEGAVAAYLIIAILFTYCYRIIFSIIPDSFTINFTDGPLTVEEAANQFTYFSFVTLTTTGYGDITATHPFARSFVMLEGLIGQLYPAILIARLVSMEIESKRSSKKSSKEE
ncbi:potassium channel family protein [Solitalea lacus]|uniref:potassium channel family protein n=1 Tax=Solitalea lacus TaxID=2911172 RepID=UPI001EDA8D76|nr:potassium channel family protein [Solitalea lacus]UKJ09045.1 potassium channel family protein [Solitalea lacus]